MSMTFSIWERTSPVSGNSRRTILSLSEADVFKFSRTKGRKSCADTVQYQKDGRYILLSRHKKTQGHEFWVHSTHTMQVGNYPVYSPIESGFYGAVSFSKNMDFLHLIVLFFYSFLVLSCLRKIAKSINSDSYVRNVMIHEKAEINTPIYRFHSENSTFAILKRRFGKLLIVHQ